MKYMGSKTRYAKQILPLVLKERKEGQWYVEPFAGGFNMIDKVKGNRIASDSNFYLIELFKAIQNGWTPPNEISENEYASIRDSKEKYPACLVGFVGFGCSYAGKWFGGYARGNTNKGIARNYCEESKRNILNQRQALQGVHIQNLNYWELDIPENSIVYCDPPYAGTTKYKDKLDYPRFWAWVRELSKEHQVFVSEYVAPEDFECIWSKVVNNTLTKETGAKQGVERLFTLKR